MVDWLEGNKCEMVAMESTSVYWKPLVNIFEMRGLKYMVVNAKDFKAVPGRKAELTKDLPIEEVHCELHGEDCTCDHCGQEMKPMGKKVIREEVCFIPAKLYKKVYIAHTYACDCHDPLLEAKPIRCAQTPKAPIQRSLAGASVLTWMIHQKYELSLPLYRQEKEWQTYGLELSRRTMANWMMTVAKDWLRPLYDVFAKRLVKEDILHADETHYQVLNRTDGHDATAQARI